MQRDFSFPAMDKMIKENGWICPIKPVYGDNAYFFAFKCLCKRGFTALTSTDKYYLFHVFVISQTVNLRVLSA